MHFRLAVGALIGVAAAASGCRSVGTAQLESTPLAVPPVCTTAATFKNDNINNYGWIPAGPQSDALDHDPATPPTTPDAARKLIASFFDPACAAAVQDHLLKNRPNLYLYFTGYGAEAQSNQRVDEGELMRWINQRDPKALILSVSWNCSGAASKDWCLAHAEDLNVQPTDDEYIALDAAFKDLAATPADAAKQSATLAAFANQSQLGYNRALSHALWIGAHVIDTFLAADADPAAPLGQIHVLGYSMGAHAAADIMIQPFTVPPSNKAFTWQTPGVCEDGTNTCAVAGLKKLHWSLSLGLSGWSDAMRGYNKGRDPAERAQFGNGGFLRFKDPKYRGKLVAFNRRTDPTASSDDTFQRGINDALFGEYNHYGHDYTNPLFKQPAFCREIDAFLEAPPGTVADVQDAGTYYDNAGLVQFDDCPAAGPCSPSTMYYAHAQSRSHGIVATMIGTPAQAAPAGVPEIASDGKLAGDFSASGAQPLAVYTMDQEDLRGAVEMYYQPTGPVGTSSVNGLFSYGSCKGDGGDLMPQAYFEAGNLVFTARYQGDDYQVRLPLASTPEIAVGKWTHLSFAWELPTVPLTAGYRKGDKAGNVARLKPAMSSFGPTAISVAAGLRRPPPTTYRAQAGAGELAIYVNGRQRATAPLGKGTSSRDCEGADVVLNNVTYTVAPGVNYPPYSPYANYASKANDVVALSATQVLGRKCKGYHTRNTKVFFGCAKDAGVTASGLMDDIVLIYGAGRRTFTNVDAATGLPKPWFTGVKYDATPFQAP